MRRIGSPPTPTSRSPHKIARAQAPTSFPSSILVFHMPLCGTLPTRLSTLFTTGLLPLAPPGSLHQQVNTDACLTHRPHGIPRGDLGQLLNGATNLPNMATSSCQRCP